jgi:hypothetical protein
MQPAWRVLSGTMNTARGPVPFHYPNVVFYIEANADGEGMLHVWNRRTNARMDRPCSHVNTMGIARILDWARHYGALFRCVVLPLGVADVGQDLLQALLRLLPILPGAVVCDDLVQATLGSAAVVVEVAQVLLVHAPRLPRRPEGGGIKKPPVFRPRAPANQHSTHAGRPKDTTLDMVCKSSLWEAE